MAFFSLGGTGPPEGSPSFSPLNCTCVREEQRAAGTGGGRSLETPGPWLFDQTLIQVLL